MKRIYGLMLLGSLAGAFLVACQKPALESEGARSQALAHRNEAGKLVCPVMGSTIASEAASAGHSDHDGKRYYFCCADCKPKFDADPQRYASGSKQGASKPIAPEIQPVKVGKYVIELWPPEDGVYAGEAVDVEVGVFDSTRKEADGGLAGVADVEVSAVVTMPSMEGMPAQRPHIHKEGRAGVYGLELYFPHGGEYKVELRIQPRGQAPIRAAFLLPVADARPTAAAKSAPYELQVVGLPASARAGQPFDLKLRVLDTKTGEPVRAFETVHEQKFHLLLASKDLTRFLHLHPTMSRDGTWTQRLVLPAGGEWWVYGDVAPVGRGSRVLIQRIELKGEPPKGNGMLVAGQGPARDRSIVGRIEPLEQPIPIGRTTTLRVRLTDAVNGKPISDTQKWLGAAGHLMIIHEDGQTIVHSHPKDDPQTAALVKQGQVQFTGRFPKAGRYVAYAQFQRHGQIHTLGFTLHVH